MVVFLYGPDSYRRGQKLKELISEYEKRHSALSVAYFDLEEERGIDELKIFSESQSLFDKTKLGIAHNPEVAGKTGAALYKNLLEDKKITLILLSDKKPTKDFVFLLKKPSLAQEFEQLNGQKLISFIKKEAEARGSKIPQELIQSLAQTYGGDTWALVNELEKIALGGDFKGQEAEPAFFPLIQTLKGGRTLGQKLSALTALLQKEDPAAIFNVLASLADPALKIKMADCDVLVKSGKLEYEEALLDLAISDHLIT